MKFCLSNTIVFLSFIVQIISLQYSDKPGLKELFKVPGFSNESENNFLEPRFKSVKSFLRDDPEPKPNDVNLKNNKKVNDEKNNSNASSNKNNKKNSNGVNVVDLSSPEKVLNAWASITSESFLNQSKFPTITQDAIAHNIELRGITRLNQFWKEGKSSGIPTDETFWFVLRGQYIYYFSSKSDLNILGSFYVKSMMDKRHYYSPLSGTEDSCMEVISQSDASYTLCFESKSIKFSWLCSLQKLQNLRQEIECMPPDSVGDLDFQYKPEYVEVKDVQPILIIPTGSRRCNNKWNYSHRGADWECICKDGLRQSPIDLPLKESAELTSVHHMFQYDHIESTINFDIVGGYIKQNNKVRISFKNGAVRILHPNLGKIVDNEGGVYLGEEITFHTPSEHTINGKRFDLEMQVIHYGRSQGDIAKQIVVSFLFVKTPGIYNKLFDNFNFIDLPNPLDVEKDITKDFSIFDLYDQPGDESSRDTRYFSYYQYDGSLTFPPCTERTRHFVVADPIPLSSTVIQLFQEALVIPDMASDTQIFVNRNSSFENIREIQPLNNRSVTLYDNKKFGCINYESKKPKKAPGHWEKRSIKVPHYIYVRSAEPSGITGAEVIEKDETALNLINS